MTKLSANQCKVLSLIRDEGVAAYWDTNTYRSLLRLGLLERCDKTVNVGHGVTFTTHLCRITSAGNTALEGRKVQP